MNFIEKIKEELNRDNPVDGVKLQGNKSIYISLISVLVLFISSIAYVVTSFFWDGSELEKVVKANEEKIEAIQVKKETPKEVAKTVLTKEELELFRKTYKQDSKLATQEFFGLNIKWEDFFKTDFSNFMKENNIKNVRLEVSDYANYVTMINNAFQGRGININVYVDNLNNIQYLKKVKSNINTIEIPFSLAQLNGLEAISKFVKEENLHRADNDKLKTIVVGNENEIKLLYEKNLSHYFDYWGVYEQKSIEETQERIKPINYQLHLNWERGKKSVVVVRFTSNDDLEFIKGVRKISVINRIYFDNYNQYKTVVEKFFNQKVWESEIVTTQEEKPVEQPVVAEQPKVEPTVVENETVGEKIDLRNLTEEQKQKIDNILEIEDKRERNLQILEFLWNQN